MQATGGIAVVYDQGSASPHEIAVGMAGLGPISFVAAGSTHVARVRPVLERIGRFVGLTGETDRDAAAVARLRPRAILTFSDQLLPTTAALAEALGLPYHTPRTALVLTDKWQQRRVLERSGVDAVRSRVVNHRDDLWRAVATCGLPAVLKPRRGQSSRHTYPVPDEAAAAALAATLFADDADTGVPSWVLEEMLVGRDTRPFGDYVSVETASEPGGSIVPVAVTGNHPMVAPFRELGHFWPSTLDRQEQRDVVELAVSAVSALGVTLGFCHTEIKLTATGPRIIEVNGRLSGHLNELARRSCGVDLVRSCAALALGRPLPHGRLTPARVFFQFNTPAPVEPCRLRAVHGAARVRTVPGVTAYRSYVRPGEHLPGGVGTRQLDLLCGDAQDHEAMLGVLAAALPLLSFEYEAADGRIWVAPPVPGADAAAV